MERPADEAQRQVREGRAHFKAGRLAQAEACFRAALGLFPGHAATLHALAAVRSRQGDHAEAERLLRRGFEAAEPGSRLQPILEQLVGQHLLYRRRWAEGFAHVDAWRRIPEFQANAAPDLGLPIWDGGPLAGRRLLVWGEEGLGDQILYARFAPLLKAEGASVVWAAPEPLRRLFDHGLGIETVGIGQSVQADLMVGSTALPVRFMARLAAPPPAPYLTPPAPNPITGARIGVKPAGSPANANNAVRSMPSEAAETLRALPGALDLDPAVTGAADFLDTAAIIMALDLVIAVDTAVAHLAGALGKPVWLLLPHGGTDWRWGREETTSPWYPSMRIFRQPAPGDWAGVLDEVRGALAEA